MKITVSAGSHDRPAGPVAARVPSAPMTTAIQLLDERRQAPVPCQIEGMQLVWWCEALEAGETRTFRIGDWTGEAASDPVRVEPFGSHGVAVSDRHGLFTRYCHGPDLVRPILYPLNETGGQCVTRHYPMEKVAGETDDHVHHRSCWVAWGDVNGVDHWSEEAGHGWQRHRVFDGISSGSVHGGLRAVVDWTTADGQRQLVEHRTYRFYNCPDEIRIFDMTVRMALTDGDVRFGDTKEGGICSVRVARSMDGNRDGHFITGAGARGEDEGWGKPAPWCDYVGPVGGKTVGITIMDHPANFRHPTTWHVRDYGLMTANPFGLSAFTGDASNDGSHTWGAGETIVWRYRVAIHAGDTAQADIAGHYANFADPVEVTID